jgi:hypothetical protein
MRHSIFENIRHMNVKEDGAEKTAYTEIKLRKSSQHPNRAIAFIISYIQEHVKLATDLESVRISNYTDEEWSNIETFISGLPKEDLKTAIDPAQKEAQVSESLENLLQEKGFREFIEKFIESLLEDTSVKRKEKLSDFVYSVLEKDGNHLECTMDDDATCILQNLAVIHAHFASSNDEEQAQLHLIARRMMQGWLVPAGKNIFLLGLKKEELKAIMDELKANPKSIVDWSFMRSRQAGVETENDTVTQRLMNAVANDENAPLIDFSSGEKLDGQDIKNVLKGGQGYKLLSDTKSLPDFEEKEPNIWMVAESWSKEHAKIELPLLITRIQEHPKIKEYMGLLHVGIIVTDHPHHHVNVILSYQNGKFIGARVGDSIGDSDGKDFSTTGLEVFGFVKGVKEAKVTDCTIEHKATDREIGHIGVLCGDLALMDLETQLKIDLFDGKMKKIKEELQNGKIKIKDKVGSRIREATYYAVARGKAKTMLSYDSGENEEQLKKAFFAKIKKAATHNRLTSVVPSSSQTDSSGSPSSQTKQTDSSGPPSSQTRLADSSGSPSTPNTIDELSDTIKIQQEADGSETLIGNFLTAKIIKGEGRQVPKLEFSFLESKKVKDLNEAEKQQKCGHEFNKMLEKLYSTLSSDEGTDNWKRGDDNKIVVDIVISGDMSQQKQAQLKEMVSNSNHFTLGKVLHKDDKRPVRKSNIGQALKGQSMLGNGNQSGHSSMLEVSANANANANANALK